MYADRVSSDGDPEAYAARYTYASTIAVNDELLFVAHIEMPALSLQYCQATVSRFGLCRKPP